jgi:hypothetical protein
MSQNDSPTHSCRVLLEQLGNTLTVSGFDADEVLRVSQGLADIVRNNPNQIVNYVDARHSTGATVNASGHDMNLQQTVGNALGEMDLSTLGEQLQQLRVEISRLARTPDENLALVNIAKAETAVADRDLSKTVEYLKSSGKWVLEVATKIGASVAGTAISHSLGLK